MTLLPILGLFFILSTLSFFTYEIAQEFSGWQKFFILAFFFVVMLLILLTIGRVL